MAALNPIFETLAGGAIIVVGLGVGVGLQRALRSFGPIKRHGQSDASYVQRRHRDKYLKSRFGVPAASLQQIVAGTTSMLPYEEELVDRLSQLPEQASNPPLDYKLAQRLADCKPGPEVPFDERSEAHEEWNPHVYWTGSRPLLWHNTLGPGTVWPTGTPIGGRMHHEAARDDNPVVHRALSELARRQRAEQVRSALGMSGMDRARLMRDKRAADAREGRVRATH